MRSGSARSRSSRPTTRGSLHARSADETVEIGSYLDSEEHIRAAKQSGADAIHPGYGFLAENGDFAEAVEAAGLTWVGPPPEALRAGGDKLAAKLIAAQAGVPTIPEACRAAADREGGRRRRRPRHARRPSRPASSTRRSRQPVAKRRRRSATTASTSSATSNGRATSRSSCSPTRTGRCSPSASATARCSAATRRSSRSRRRRRLDPKLRAEISDAAVRFARAIGYVGAGTAEFVLEDREFFFLELNGRIQVEHPVTEAVTGVDLVQWQLRIARGERLDFEAAQHGAAVEVRLYAEDPRTFLPQAGRIDVLRLPSSVRVDAGVERGRRDRHVLRLADREADRTRRDARRGARPPRRGARGDRGRRRDDQPAVPALARRPSRAPRRRDDDGVPRRAPAALGARRSRSPDPVWRGRLPAQPAAARAPQPPPDVDAAAHAHGPAAESSSDPRPDARHGARG